MGRSRGAVAPLSFSSPSPLTPRKERGTQGVRSIKRDCFAHNDRMGEWESLDMVLRYTRSVGFEDSLRH